MKIGLEKVKNLKEKDGVSKKSIGILAGVLILLGGLAGIGRAIVKKKDKAE